MGTNFLILASTLLLPSFHRDTTHSEQPSHGLGYERLSDLLEYNRVQGLSLGLGYQAHFPAGATTTVHATVRYGLSDERVTWRVSTAHELGGGRLQASGYYDVTDVDPLAPGGTFANTMNGLFAGHDNGDYGLTRGGSISWDMPVGTNLLLQLSARIERQNSGSRTARSAVNDFLGGSGLFPPNPPVTEGTFGGGSLGLSGLSRFQWKVTADVLGGSGHAAGRIYGGMGRRWGSAPEIWARLQAGIGTEPGLLQTLFRVGGLNTVRGFEYGTQRAPAFWSGQLDVALLGGRVRPLLFLDVGQASRLTDLVSGPVLVGAGAGISVLRGLIRFDLSRPVSPDIGGKLRFDLILQRLR